VSIHPEILRRMTSRFTVGDNQTSSVYQLLKLTRNRGSPYPTRMWVFKIIRVHNRTRSTIVLNGESSIHSSSSRTNSNVFSFAHFLTIAKMRGVNVSRYYDLILTTLDCNDLVLYPSRLRS